MLLGCVFFPAPGAPTLHPRCFLTATVRRFRRLRDDAYLLGNGLTLADLHGVCGLAPVIALLPFDFPKVEDWLLGLGSSTVVGQKACRKKCMHRYRYVQLSIHIIFYIRIYT